MIAGVVSDPHGDRAALQAALDACRRLGCDELWCLGDLVGDPESVGTVELALTECAVVIAGNHDLVAVERLPGVHIDAHGGPAMERLRTMMTPDVRSLLEALPEKVVHQGVEMTHASLHDPLSRVHDARSAETQLGLSEEKVVLVGHSHRPFYYDHGDGRFHSDPLACGRVALSEYGGVLCPGSVLSLPGSPATVLTLDLRSYEARWHEVPSG